MAGSGVEVWLHVFAGRAGLSCVETTKKELLDSVTPHKVPTGNRCGFSANRRPLQSINNSQPSFTANRLQLAVAMAIVTTNRRRSSPSLPPQTAG